MNTKRLLRFVAGIVVLAFIAVFANSCSKYDDSEIQDEIRQLQEKVNSLEKQCENINDNISQLNQLVKAQLDNDPVTSVRELPNSTGFELELLSGKKITLSNGLAGKDNTGNAPVVGIRQYEDGVWYWTLDNEFIVVEGKMLKVYGADGVRGVVPMVKVEAGYWLVSYDEGRNWEKLYSADDIGSIPSNPTLIVAINETKDGYDIVLNGNSVIRMPKQTLPGKVSISSIYIMRNTDDKDELSEVYGCSISWTWFYDNSVRLDRINLIVQVFPEEVIPDLIKAPGSMLSAIVSYYDDDGNVLRVSSAPVLSVSVLCGPLVSVTIDAGNLDKIICGDWATTEIPLEFSVSKVKLVAAGDGSLVSNEERLSREYGVMSVAGSSAEVKVDGLVWATMNVGATAEDIKGKTFSFAEAQHACPSGWRLPTLAEMEAVQRNVEWSNDGTWFSGSEYWHLGSPAVFLPYTYVEETSGRKEKCAVYWTGTDAGDGRVWTLYMNDYGSPSGSLNLNHSSGRNSVRCVKK